MANAELLKNVAIYDEYIDKHGIDERVIDAYCQAVAYAFQENDVEYGLELCKTAKRLIDTFITKKTNGGTWDVLERYCFDRGEKNEWVDRYYSILKYEAQNRIVDSYFLCLERYRDPEDRFYLPRRKQLLMHGYIKGLQDIVDDKLDILSVSMPPGVGKAQPLDSLVLTPHGYVRMGDVKVGMCVCAGNGRKTIVDGVFPQGEKSIYEITLENGKACKCSKDHLWHTHNGDHDYKVISLDEIMNSGRMWLLPYRDDQTRKTRWSLIKSIKYVGEKECQCIHITDPTHLYITNDYIITHNTTMEEFFLSGMMGWFPELSNLFSSHSGHVTRMVYDVIYNILGIGVKQGHVAEYAWREIFPDIPIENTNAKEEEINLGKFKPFKTLTCRALGASQTGVTRCEGILCCDDLCSGIEMALSRMRLDKLWMMYSTDLKTRKKKGKGGRSSKELHIATRWSVWDVIGRIKTIYADDERARFISVPDIDPDTHESNFDFDYGVGFDVKYFEDIQKSLDEITYKCLYKNEPVEREGILFNTDVLRRYTSFPFNQKTGEELRPDGIIALCDTKDTGKDYNCLGVFRVYGQDYYLVDVVFRNIDPLALDDLNAQCLVKNNVQVATFESNKEGSRTADKVQEKVKEMGGSTVIEKRYTTANKETKIIVNSPWVVAHVVFPQPESADYPNGYKPNSEMGQFMAHLCSWSQLSKNAYDDAPDMVSMLAVRENPLMGGMAKVSAVQNPFRRGK